MLTENEIKLVTRCRETLRFLAKEPTEAQCAEYLLSHDIDMSGAQRTARQKLFLYCGLHLNVLLRETIS